MLVTNEQRDSAEETATLAQLQLYDTPEAGAKLRAIADTLGITSDKMYNAYAIAVGDLILGLVPTSQMRELFAERLPDLSGEQLNGLVSEIEQFLVPLQKASSLATDLQAEISSLETTVSQLPPMRTMSHDMQQYTEEEQTYSAANQDDLLKREPADSRWETDTND
jgi:hypothetical protein